MEEPSHLRKRTIVILVSLIVAIILAVSLVLVLRKNISSTDANSSSSATGIDGKSAESYVATFYNKYIVELDKESRKANFNVQSRTLSNLVETYTSSQFYNAYIDNTSSTNPVTCLSEVPADSPTFTVAETNGLTATITAVQKVSGASKQFSLSVTQDKGMKITNVYCS